MVESIQPCVFGRLVFWLAGLCAGAVFAVSPEPVDPARDDALAQQGIYLPYQFENPTTPPTRALRPQEAEAALQRDWLFQAEGKPLATLRPMQYLSRTSRLIDLAGSGTHYDVKVDPLSLHRLIAWVDSCGVYLGEEEVHALGDPDFPGIERLPIRPRVATAPVIERP